MLILFVLVAAVVLSIGAFTAMVCAVVSDALCHRRSHLLARQPRGDTSRVSRPAVAGT